MRRDRIENHLTRERQCRNNADRAELPEIRKLHLDLAERHASKRRELENQVSYLAAASGHAAPAGTDERGARALHDSVQRPIRAA